MDLPTLWFLIIAGLWLGYLLLEGVDCGVGMLLRVLGHTDSERRVIITTIRPGWYGNEVWLLLAVGVTYAAFPSWLPALLGTAYLLPVPLALVGRGLALRCRSIARSDRWRRTCDRVIVLGSWISALGVGAVLATGVAGMPIGAAGDRAGPASAMLRPESWLGAAGIAGYALVHGSVFIALKTEGAIRERARAVTLLTGPVALLPLAVLLLVIQIRYGAPWLWGVVAVVAVAVVAALARVRARREGQAFALLGVAVAGTVLTLFGALHPYVLPSTVHPAYSLTIAGTAAGPYRLTVLAWAMLFGAPVALAHQVWAYRKRVSTRRMPPVRVP